MTKTKSNRPSLNEARLLHEATISELKAEVVRRSRKMRSLRSARSHLMDELDAIERELRQLGGARSKQRRPRNEKNLVESLRTLLRDRTMTVTEAAAHVQEAGYRTTSENFRTIVNQTLINSGQFKRVSRGRYTAK